MAGKNIERFQEDCTLDGTLDRRGRPAIRARTGKWFAGTLLLVNQALVSFSFWVVYVNLVLFLTRVMGQNNSKAANEVSKWTGTVYIFSLFGAFLSDSYWGRYKTCAIFQLIYVIGLLSLSLSSYLFLVKPSGCGDDKFTCNSHSSVETALFYTSIYLIALGYGGYEPTVATFGADQFDEEHPKESHSKVAFFSYFYLALNLGSLFSNTIIGYFENKGKWTLGFGASTVSAIAALALFLAGTARYRYFIPKENPFSRFCQVIVAASRKWKVKASNDEKFYEVQESDVVDNGARRILHTDGYKFLDKAAIKTQKDDTSGSNPNNPWRLCSVTQVEEVKCILRLLPIWLCTIIFSVVYTQMSSLFIEQGAAMETTVGGFEIPPASMSSFELVSAVAFVLVHRRVIDPILFRLRPKSGGLTELERMGIALIIAVMAMVSAGLVEHFRLKQEVKSSSSLSIFWQVPQYVFIGASEIYMLVGQMEFFNGQAPDRLKSFGSALSMTSISLGNYASSLILTVVSEISSSDGNPGWISRKLNKGHLDRFFYLLAALTAVDFVVYVVCAKCYNYTKFEERRKIKDNDVRV